MKLNVSMTIKGTETITLRYAQEVSAIDAAASVARILGDYTHPAVADDEFTTQLISIHIDVVPE